MLDNSDHLDPRIPEQRRAYEPMVGNELGMDDFANMGQCIAWIVLCASVPCHVDLGKCSYTLLRGDLYNDT